MQSWAEIRNSRAKARLPLDILRILLQRCTRAFRDISCSYIRVSLFSFFHFFQGGFIPRQVLPLTLGPIPYRRADLDNGRVRLLNLDGGPSHPCQVHVETDY